MKYDIITVYNCISEETNFIAETTEDIKNLKQDLEKAERKVDIVTVQYSILKSLIGLHEMVLYTNARLLIPLSFLLVYTTPGTSL